jgi:NADPH2:quinone reductase
MWRVEADGTAPGGVRLVERPSPHIAASAVLVRVSYAGLNPVDISVLRGRVAPSGSGGRVCPGVEVAGMVARIGASVTRWKPGDLVLGLVKDGGLATEVVAAEDHLALAPPALTQPELAAVPESFICAHDALFSVGRLGRGQTVLIRGATGGVGTAAVQLAVAAGASVVGISGTTKGRRALEELGATGAAPTDAINREVDVLLDLVGGDYLDTDIDLLNPGGRVVVLGSRGPESAKVNISRLKAKCATITGTRMRDRPHHHKARAVSLFEDEVIPVLNSGIVRPIIDRAFSATDIGSAIAHLERRGRIGKVLIYFERSEGEGNGD